MKYINCDDKLFYHVIHISVITLQICPFPIFTRSGEVSVSLELSPDAVELTEIHVEKIVTFLNYTFTNVLRLQKYLMMFDPNAAENSYFIVPTFKGEFCNS